MYQGNRFPGVDWYWATVLDRMRRFYRDREPNPNVSPWQISDYESD